MKRWRKAEEIQKVIEGEEYNCIYCRRLDKKMKILHLSSYVFKVVGRTVTMVSHAYIHLYRGCTLGLPFSVSSFETDISFMQNRISILCTEKLEGHRAYNM
jgi:hypothetical protein